MPFDDFRKELIERAIRQGVLTWADVLQAREAALRRGEPDAPRLRLVTDEQAGADDETPTGQDPEERALGTIGPYEILMKLGQDDAGAVFVGVREDDEAKTAHVIQLVRARSAEELRHHRGAEHNSCLEHTNIATIFDRGATEDGYLYYITEFVGGEPIDVHCDVARLSVEKRLELFLRICSAMELAHKNLIAHVDLKPTSVRVDPEGIPKLLPGMALTPRGLCEYPSPEELRGERLTTASDVYSLGVLLYKLLTGVLPTFGAESETPTPSEMIRIISEHDLAQAAEIGFRRGTTPRRLRQRLRGDLDHILLKAVHPDPQERYTLVRELSDDLRRHLEHLPVAGRPATPLYRAAKFTRRHLFGVLATTALALFSIAFVVSLAIERNRIASQAATLEAMSQFLEGTLRSLDPNEEGPGSVVEALEAASEQIEATLGGEPEIEAAVRHKVGTIFQNFGRYEEAEALFRESLEIRIALHGEVHPAVAETQARLGGVLWRKGDYDGAEELYQQTLKTSEELFGKDHPVVIDAVEDLANVLWSRARYREADPLYREVLAKRRAILGEDDPKVTDALNNLSNLLQKTGNFDEAEPLMRQVLERDRRRYGNEHPVLARSLNNLGMLLHTKGAYTEAKRFVGQALEMNRRLVGSEHPSTANNLNNLAQIHIQTKDYGSAEPLLRESLRVRQRLFGTPHRSVARVLNNLGVLYRRSGDYRRAEDYVRQGLEMRKGLLGNHHHEVAASLDSLGAIKQAQGQSQEAEALVREALRMRRELLGEENPLVAWSLHHLATLQEQRGAIDEAEALYRHALSIQAKLFDSGHPAVREMRESLDALLRHRTAQVHAQE